MSDDDLRSPPFEGTTWHLLRGVDHPQGMVISARFAGGTVSGSVGSNRYRAPYERDDAHLRVGPATASGAATDPAEERTQQALFTLLGAVDGTASGDEPGTLTLRDATNDPILWFEAAAALDPELAGSWRVRGILDGDERITPVDGTDPHLAFAPDEGHVSGSTGVNRVRATARSDGTRLTLGPLAITRMAGAPEAMDVEAAMTGALDRVAAFRLDGSSLALLDADGRVRVELER